MVPFDRGSFTPTGSPIRLADRHTVYHSVKEKKRLKAAGAEVSQKKGMEDALIARNKDGTIYKAIMPSRSFGDADFKQRVAPIRALVATPSGRGVGYEGGAAELEGEGPWMLIVACDGLWDFVEEKDVIKEAFSKRRDPQEMVRQASVGPSSAIPFALFFLLFLWARPIPCRRRRSRSRPALPATAVVVAGFCAQANRLVRVAQSRKYESNDDVTVIIGEVAYPSTRSNPGIGKRRSLAATDIADLHINSWE